MTGNELLEYSDALAERHRLLIAQVEHLGAASPDEVSADHSADALAEALFLRAFTAYESGLELLFFHYVTGGVSIRGSAASTYLRLGDEQIARRMVRGSFKFLSWGKPDAIRQTASCYIENGWPIVDMLATKTQELADCERIRNRIAHASTEAATAFNTVQRNLLSTERLFDMSPGQLLRIRHKTYKRLHLLRFADVMNETLAAIIDPPQ